MVAVSASPPRLTPRPYQVEAVVAVLQSALHGIKRLLSTLPTGTGKTIIVAHLLQHRPGRALVLAHRDERIQQTVDKLGWVAPDLHVGVVKADRDAHDAPVVVARV